MNKKKIIAVSAIAGLAISLGAAGVASADDRNGGRGEKITAILSGLVTKGSITQVQADAIAKAMMDARDAAETAHDASRAEKTKVITDLLGIDASTLKSRLQAGESLATIAGAKKDALISALVAFETKKIDSAVVAGKLTAAQATAMKANLTVRVTSEVEETRGMGKGPKGFPHHKGKGHGRGGH